jgi:DNA-binding beta-propeller fold protein YncE
MWSRRVGDANGPMACGMTTARGRLTLAAFASLLTLVGMMASGPTPAFAVRGWVFSGTFGSPGSEEGQFEFMPASRAGDGVAVDEAADEVYVADARNNRVQYFSASGTFLGQFDGSGTHANEGGVKAPEALSRPAVIAVDNACAQHHPRLTESTTPTCAQYDPSAGDVYVVDRGEAVVYKFSPTGQYLGQITETRTFATGAACLEHEPPLGEAEPFAETLGVAVDPKGKVFVLAEQYEPDAKANLTRVSSYSSTQPNAFTGLRCDKGYASDALAVDSEDGWYGLGFGNFVEEDASNGKTITEKLDSEPGSGVAVEEPGDDAYVDNLASIARYAPSGAQLERFGAGNLIEGTGIGVNTTGQRLYVADAGGDDIAVFSPEPPGPPTIEGSVVTDVASTSATLMSEVNPRGPSSEYRFEYGPCASTKLSSCAASPYPDQSPRPDGSLGSGFAAVPVSLHLDGLEPDTTYHFRTIAHNELGNAQGEEGTFTTQPTGGALTLLDNRQWELVSPPNMHGAYIEPIFEGLIQASANGDAFASFARIPTEADTAGNANDVYIYSGRGANGWASRDISTPHTYSPGVSVGAGTEVRFFSEDLASAIMQPFGGFTPLAPDATEPTAYLRANYLGGDAADLCAESCYQPLVTATNVPTGTHFGEIDGKGDCTHLICGPNFVGASADGKHVVLQSSAQLTEMPIPPNEAGGQLYEWTEGTLQLISVLPEGEGGEAANEPSLGLDDRAARNAISADGTRIVFASGSHLYLRDTETRHTTRLDLPETGGSAEYMDASSDGSRIFFLDEAGLTARSSARGRDLYEYDVNAPEGERLKDLSVDANAEEPANVANVIGASDDGSYVYFAAAGALTAGAAAGDCGGGGGTGFCNLYVSHEGTLALVSSVAQADSPDWAHGASSNLQDLVGRVSPNGHYLAFMSQLPLTGYDSRDAVSGRPDEEVYLYEAQTAKLVCASCNPTGSRPTGEEYTGGNAMRRVAGFSIWESGAWLAALIPGWTDYETGTAHYQSRYLSDSGRLFFDSHDPLVPEDVGGSWSVYEYEPPGVGSCTAASASYSERVGGCQGLISSGTSSEESAFLDASETGGDVFFLTSQDLVRSDVNLAGQVYDAHECTAASPCFPTQQVQPPPCESGEACKSAPNAQPAVFGAPPSATFSGAENLTTTPAPVVKGHPATRAQNLRRAIERCMRRFRHNRQRRRSCVHGARQAAKHHESTPSGR